LKNQILEESGESGISPELKFDDKSSLNSSVSKRFRKTPIYSTTAGTKNQKLTKETLSLAFPVIVEYVEVLVQQKEPGFLDHDINDPDVS
tara:strand:+ start:312 stop:581 length:270 start_codon:yes stop_codon:yes gene_type:complete